MLTYTSVVTTYKSFRTKFANDLIIRIKKYRVQGLCFRSNISETVEDIRVPFSLFEIARVVLPDGTNVVSVVVIVSEI